VLLILIKVSLNLNSITLNTLTIPRKIIPAHIVLIIPTFLVYDIKYRARLFCKIRGDSDMEMRLLGQTGESLSVIGFGAMVFVKEGPEFAINSVARAIDSGINYFDLGPSYGAGEAEERAGPAIKPYRDKIFLAEKTTKRTKNEAADELNQSLRRMHTNYFDLYQLHGVTTLEEVQTIIGPGGALEAFVEAREKGLVRFLGFSAHTEEAALALMEHFNFDSILFPINYVIWHQGNFGPKIVNKAVEKEVGILALKTLAKTTLTEGQENRWMKAWYSPVETYDEAKTALGWTLSRPVTSCVSPSDAEFLWWMIDAEKEISALTSEDEEIIHRSTQNITPLFPIADIDSTP